MKSERFLIDTTVWIKFFRGTDESLKDRITTLVLQNCAYTSEIIVMEILRGAKSEKEYRMLYDDFTALPFLSIDRDVWELSWKNAYKLKKKGVTIPLADIIIASTALHYDCILMHSDKHFDLVCRPLKLRTLKV